MNEHLATLTMTENKENPLSSIPSQTKAKLTRLFNKRHEDAKLKQQKTKKGNEQHAAKYDPVLEEL